MRVPENIQKALDELSVPYRVEIGKKHQKIFVGNRLAGVIARNSVKGSTAGRGGLNIIAQIKRAEREQIAGKGQRCASC